MLTSNRSKASKNAIKITEISTPFDPFGDWMLLASELPMHRRSHSNLFPSSQPLNPSHSDAAPAEPSESRLGINLAFPALFCGHEEKKSVLHFRIPKSCICACPRVATSHNQFQFTSYNAEFRSILKANNELKVTSTVVLTPRAKAIKYRLWVRGDRLEVGCPTAHKLGLRCLKILC